MDWSRLSDNVDAFALLIRIHYEHYQFYANMFVAVAIGYGCHRFADGWPGTIAWMDAGFIMLEVVFFAASRDTLQRYYMRTRQLLGTK